MTNSKAFSLLTAQLKRSTFICALSLAISTQAFAQNTEAQFGTAFPARAEQQIVTPDFTPDLKARVDVKESRIQSAPEGAENVAFKLDRLIVSGVTVYSDEVIMDHYDEHLGQNITLVTLYGIAGDMTRMYRNDGYILTQVVVPPQTIEGGTAKLQVVEGYIDQISVQGDEPESATHLINQIAHDIKKDDAPLNVNDLERSLLLINDLPGVTARSILSPSNTKTGAADLTIIVDRDPFSATASIDNYGTKYLGPIQVGGAVSANSYFDMNETITGQLFVAPDNDEGIELFYASIAYEQPVWDRGTLLRLFVSNTHTEPGDDLRQFDVRGRSQYLSAELQHPFIRTRNFNFSGHFKFDYRNADSRNNIDPSVDPTRKDRIRAVRSGGRFEYLDRFFGAGFNTLNFELAKGIDVLGASNEGRSTLSRPAGDPTFFKGTATLERLQRVNTDFNILMGVTGQWSNDALLSAEEFGIGGQNYGRGYDPSEVVGDEGLAGKFEIQWNEPFQISAIDKYHIYTFFDAGRVWNDDPATASLKKETLTSTGIGFRATISEGLNAGFMIGVPLNHDVQTMGDDDPRLFFNLSKQF